MKYHKINALYKRWIKGVDPIETLPAGKKFGDFKDGEFACEEFEYLYNNLWIWSEKLDGTNIRIYLNWNEALDVHETSVAGRDDNSDVPKAILDWIEKWFEENLVTLPNMFSGTDVILYAEGVGTGIQKVGKNFGEQHIKLFDVLINNFYLNKESVKDIATKLNLDTVDTWVGTIQEAIDKVKTLPKSSFGDFVIEGYVGQPLVRLQNAHGDRIVTKIKVVDFVNKSRRR